ncbi:hypothetical protein [Streptomyces sp. A244]|uniref:hypothetical protein n=1 Tax=Streptomyces sp. A244 TaxID=2137016 RepID=UPI0021591032|nr:hypothetical protein [Streptomyces sp. A244]
MRSPRDTGCSTRRGRYGLLLGVAGVAEVAGALLLAGLRMRRFALAAVLAWALLGIFRAPLGIVSSTAGTAVLLIATGPASALTDIPLIALVQQRIPSHHLAMAMAMAMAMGLSEAGAAGALAVSPFVASTTIALTGVQDAFLLTGAALVVMAMTAALTLARTARAQRPGRAVAHRRPAWFRGRTTGSRAGVRPVTDPLLSSSRPRFRTARRERGSPHRS